MGYEVRFLPDDRRWHGHDPVPLRLAAAACDILIEQPCGSRASCGRCRVRVAGVESQLRPGGSPSGGLPGHDNVSDGPDPVHVRVLGEEAVAAGWRLGCRLVLDRDLTLVVPPPSRVVAHKRFGPDRIEVERPVAGGGWGIALDVGSTTLAAAVVDRATGAVRGVASALNPQVGIGADVMSRIAFGAREPGGEAQLRRVLRGGVSGVVDAAVSAAGVSGEEMVEVAAVGNPTMLHSLQGLPIAPLGVAPYQGERYAAWSGDASGLGLGLQTGAYVFPGVRSHVGADAVAGVLATGLDRARTPRLFMDLGTNTELVLAAEGGLWCTSAASGPAFEGAAIRHGMRAIPGAIDQVWIAPDGRLLTHTIGGETDRAGQVDGQTGETAGEPVGICGSGVVDAAAALLDAGVLEPSGRMRTAAEVAERTPALAGRVVVVDGERAVRLTDGPRPVLLTAGDVRELQLVKGSIGAAIRLLLRTAGIDASELEEVVLAGAFGSYVRGASAGALGLIPSVDPARIRFAGNAAGAGARLGLVDRRARERAERIAAETRFVELAGRPDYEEAFVEMLGFPEPSEVG